LESDDDLKLGVCLETFQGARKLPPLKTTELEKVANAFFRNITRVCALILFPPAGIRIGVQVERLERAVRSKRSGLTREEVAIEVTEGLREWGRQELNVLATNQSEYEAGMRRDLAQSFGVLGLVNMDDGVQAWMAAQITGTWTAFEAMAEDLWEAALNTKPHGLAELKGKKQGTKEDRFVKLTLLQKYRYDLSHSMGTVLKGRYSFDNLVEIRKAYEEAFPPAAQAIHTAINDRALDVISLVRNVLVHSGGIIDEEYLCRAAHLPPEATGPLGSPIRLNGELVAKIAGPVLKIGPDLINAVDEWIATSA
jgi:hypothetical protein